MTDGQQMKMDWNEQVLVLHLYKNSLIKKCIIPVVE